MFSVCLNRVNAASEGGSILETKRYLLQQKRKGLIFVDRIGELEPDEPFELYYWITPPDNATYQNAFPILKCDFEKHNNKNDYYYFIKKHFFQYYCKIDKNFPIEFFIDFKPYVTENFIWYYRKAER